jgi:hypothetical protein
MRTIKITLVVEYHGFDESEAPSAAEALVSDIEEVLTQFGADAARVTKAEVVDTDAG